MDVFSLVVGFCTISKALGCQCQPVLSFACFLSDGATLTAPSWGYVRWYFPVSLQTLLDDSFGRESVLINLSTGCDSPQCVVERLDVGMHPERVEVLGDTNWFNNQLYARFVCDASQHVVHFMAVTAVPKRASASAGFFV